MTNTLLLLALLAWLVVIYFSPNGEFEAELARRDAEHLASLCAYLPTRGGKTEREGLPSTHSLFF
jgi:hypothetical protein